MTTKEKIDFLYNRVERIQENSNSADIYRSLKYLCDLEDSVEEEQRIVFMANLNRIADSLGKMKKELARARRRG